MKHILIPTVILSASITASQAFIIIGTDNFDYPNGGIVNQSGGTGWNYQRTDEGHPNGASDWEGTANVSNGTLTTANTIALREYSGTSEGPGTGTGENEGAFRGTGSLFYGINLTITSYNPANPTWAGISSYDFGNERIFFGVPSQTGKFGIRAEGVNYLSSDIDAVQGASYRIVAQIDFDNDILRLWINPDANDNLGTADVSAPYTMGYWSSRLRIGSEMGAAWDNLIVTTRSPGESTDLHAFSVAAAPEPSFALLTSLGLLGLLRRRR